MKCYTISNKDGFPTHVIKKRESKQFENGPVNFLLSLICIGGIATILYYVGGIL